jgi:hydroxyacylglutathione hydrolase
MTPNLRWKAIPSGQLSCVGTLLWSEASRQTVLIDPTDDPTTFLEVLRKEGLQLRELLLTHAHVDHAAGAARVAAAFGLTPRLHPADWALFGRMPQWGRMLGLQLQPTELTLCPLCHGEVITVEEGFALEVRHTPGHTPGQVAFVIKELSLAVVGDTLFFGSVGRTDLPGGDHAALVRSIREQLYTLPDTTQVIPGHGPHTTIGREKRDNPFVRG